MSNFRDVDRQTGFLLPPSVDEWLPENHLARFVVEVVDGLDLRAMSGSYRGSGSASYHPRMLLGILVYGYATGVFSSRKLERATYELGGVPVHRGQRSSRPRHDRGVQAALSRGDRSSVRSSAAAGAGDGRSEDGDGGAGRHEFMPTPAGTARCPMNTPASRGAVESRSRRSDGQAEAADAADLPDGMSIPDELARREERLRKLAEARAKIEARAKERHAREQAEHEARLAARQAKAEASGKSPAASLPNLRSRGRAPTTRST